MSDYRATLHAQLERDAFAAEDRVREIKAQLRGVTQEGERAVLKLRLERAAADHARCLEALFAVDKS